MVPYLVPLSYQIVDNSDDNCKYSLVAIIDSKSPISLIRNNFVPIHVRPIVASQSFYGINGSKLEILGNFDSVVKINDIELKIKFFL